MESDDWLALCYRSLEIPDESDDKEMLAARKLVEQSGAPLNLLSIGAAESAIRLVVRHGEEGRLDEVLLGLDYGPLFETADERQAMAMKCASALLHAVVDYVEMRDEP